MRAAIVRLLLGAGSLAQAKAHKTTAPPLRAKAIAVVPRDDGRPVREDCGRIESRIIAARGQYQKGQYSEAVMTLIKDLCRDAALRRSAASDQSATRGVLRGTRADGSGGRQLHRGAAATPGLRARPDQKLAQRSEPPSKRPRATFSKSQTRMGSSLAVSRVPQWHPGVP